MKWDVRFLCLAKEVATWSKDPGSKVGSVIADSKHRVVGLGFNGFPPGIKDDERLQDRPTKLKFVLHAEDNAIAFASRTDLAGCTIYVWDIPPCTACASKIIRSGIARVVSPPNNREDWADNCNLAEGLMREAGIEIVHIDRSVIDKWHGLNKDEPVTVTRF